MINSLSKKLSLWVENGLISNVQYQQIIKFEDDQKDVMSWALMGFLILGAVVIGIGIISLVAANWYLTPPYLKLTGNFVFHFLLIILAMKFWQEEKWRYFEVILVLIYMLSLASIGLISQIFHTGGELFQALQLWSLMTFGLFLLSKDKFIPFVWSFTFFGTLSYTFIESTWLQNYFQDSKPALLLLIPLISLLTAIIFRFFTGDTRQTKALRFVSVFMGCSSLIIMEKIPFLVNYENFIFKAYLPSYILGVICLSSIVLNKNYNKIQKMILSVVLLLYFIPIHLSYFYMVNSFLMAFISIAAFILIALFMITVSEKRLFTLFINIVGLRFLFLYFQAFGGLAFTGFGLIISGLLIIAAVILWKKNFKAITRFAERLMQ